jgi:hypothetical protein
MICLQETSADGMVGRNKREFQEESTGSLIEQTSINKNPPRNPSHGGFNRLDG